MCVVMGLVLSALPHSSPLDMAVAGLGPCSGFKQPLLTIITLSLAYCQEAPTVLAKSLF